MCDKDHVVEKKTHISVVLIRGCKIPLARSHLRVKCQAGRVKVLTICSTFLNYSISEKNLGHEGE